MSKVTIYSTPTCGFCKMTKQYLNSRNIPYEDIDVTKNHEAGHEMIHKSGQTGVPVIDIDGQIVVGFDQRRLEQLLKVT